MDNILQPFDPLPWQIEPWRDTSQVILLTGSAGGGKSRLAGEKIHAFCLKYAGATALMMRKAREYAGKSIVPMMEYSIIGDDPRVKVHKSDSFFEYNNGSMLYWGGMRDDKQREAIRSIGKDGRVDIIWMEEANANSRLDYDEASARLRGIAAPWTQIILSTNPDTPTHWIYTDLILGNEAKVYYSAAKDNKYNPPSYLRILDNLRGVLKDRLAKGLWVQAEGAVYDEFDVGRHVIDAFDIPGDWRRFLAIDFGYSNPFVCQWWAVSPDGVMYLYREIYMSKRIVSNHARQIKELSEPHMEPGPADHDAEDRATLDDCGIYTVPAEKSISVGIQKVKDRLANGTLFIFRAALVEEDPIMAERKKPTSTEAEFSGYSWPKMSDGKIVKETPVKIDDHGMDALRYAVMYVDNRGVFFA